MRPNLPTFDDLAGYGMDDTIAAVKSAVDARENILLIGPPGCGATMIARRVTSLMPNLTEHEMRWLAAEYTGHGTGLMWQTRIAPAIRPFRAPHHTVSTAGLVGKSFHRYDAPSRAGEMHLARFGVLFLDEIADFYVATLARLTYELRNMHGAPLIVASAHGCPCGHADTERCKCSERSRMAFLSHLQRCCINFAFTTIETPTVSLQSMKRYAQTLEANR